MQPLGPIPKGMYVPGLIFNLFSVENLSGLNFSGSGQYLLSWCKAYIGIQTSDPGSKLNNFSDSPCGSIVNVFVHCLSVLQNGGYFLKVSAIEYIL